MLSVDRFDPGVPTHSMDLAPTDVLEGDIPVRTRYIHTYLRISKDYLENCVYLLALDTFFDTNQ